MIESILSGLALIATWENVLALFSGMLGGVVIGALPGLTGAMGITLALPFTFYMEPITSLMLLLGIYKGSMYGGSITAILIRTPGTAAASCTVIDGYPLVQQGKAGKALRMALYSSCFADAVSNLSLILFTGFIASMALKFGPAEFFGLIVFSLTIVGGLSGSSLLKGLLSASLGLFLATIGMDIVFGTGRMTFGNTNLLAGLSFIPVLIGLFAIPQIIKSTWPKNTVTEFEDHLGDDKISWQEWCRSFKSIVRGSIIGVILGAIPGIGAAPAAYLSYSEAKRYSKHKETFGKGEIEGVAAAEAGNNGVCGATLIPLLALGVPGDVTTAVMLGAFMMHNIIPGPQLFEEHSDLVYALYLGIMLSSFFLYICGAACIKIGAKITKVPSKILFPVILPICIFGAYSINNNPFDILVMIIMGIVGCLMNTFKIPEAPFLIGFILGPLFEDNLRRSMLMSHGNISILWSTPICWFFIALTIFSIYITIKNGKQLSG